MPKIEGERILSCVIRRDEAGARLIDFLGTRFPYHDAAGWARLAGDGALLVNGAIASVDIVLKENDLVRFRADGAPEPAADKAVSVLYEDRDIIVVDKSGNLPAHPAGRYFRNTLWGVLKEKFDVAEPSIINRLDRETSGVTLVAKNPAASDMCRKQFASRGVTKKYTAIVEGALAGPVRSRGYIVPRVDSAIRKKRRFEPANGSSPEPGREAEWADTEFTPGERHGGISVVEAVPHTGRLHQIRATLLSLGCPVVGDKMYGLDEGVFIRFIDNRLTPEDAARMRIGRQALHASSLAFLHPADGRGMAITAPLPADMRALLLKR